MITTFYIPVDDNLKAFKIACKTPPRASLLLLLVAFGVFTSPVLPVHGALMQPKNEVTVTAPFYFGNNTEETRLATPSVRMATPSVHVAIRLKSIEIYCHLYANSTSNITLLPISDYWNLTSISVDPGSTINATVNYGKLTLDSDVVPVLQLYIIRASADDVVQGLLILKVITSVNNQDDFSRAFPALNPVNDPPVHIFTAIMLLIVILVALGFSILRQRRT